MKNINKISIKEYKGIDIDLIISIRPYNPNYRWLAPNNWNNNVKKLIPFSKRFNFASYIHDNCYYIPSTKEQRKIYDELFFILCVKNSGNNLFAYIFALIYFLLVRMFGFLFYTKLKDKNKNKEKEKEKENKNKIK